MGVWSLTGAWLSIVSLLGALCTVTSDQKSQTKRYCYHSRTSGPSVYDFEIQDVDKTGVLDWSEYRGKVVLVVNVASY